MREKELVVGCGMNVMSLNYTGGRISTRVLLCALGGEKFVVIGSPTSTSTMVMGAYKFVRDTGRRDVGRVVRLNGLGSRNGVGTVVMANYLTRECGSRVSRRLCRISSIVKVNTGRAVTSVILRALSKRGYRDFPSGIYLPLRNKEVLSAPPCATCLGVTRNYSGHYSCYTVPVVEKEFHDESVRSIMGRTRNLTRHKIGRLGIVTRSAAHFNRSGCNGPVLTRLLEELYEVSNFG